MNDSTDTIFGALNNFGKKISPEHPEAALIGVAAVGTAGLVLAIATRGRIFGAGARAVEEASGILPQLEFCTGTSGRALQQLGTLETVIGLGRLAKAAPAVESVAGLAGRVATHIGSVDTAAGLAGRVATHIGSVETAAGLAGKVATHIGSVDTAAGLAGDVMTSLRRCDSALGLAGEVMPSLRQAGTATDLAGDAALTSLRQQTLGGKITEQAGQLSWKASRKILSLLGKSGEGDQPVVASDELRHTVFNRFLSRLDQDRYVLHGSYGLECRQYTVRKAVKDLDLLSLDPAIVKPTREATNAALVADLRAMMRKPAIDGLKFEIPDLKNEGLHIQVMYPRMRHAVAVAKSLDGQEILRIPLDIRLGAGTILPPTREALMGTAQAAGHAPTFFPIMAPEETFAHKLFSYTNRTIGGIERKPKDLLDMAGMLEKGLDEQKVSQALQAFTKRGYSLGALRHPSEILGSSLENNLTGQTAQQLNTNFRAVQNYYARIAQQVESQPLLADVSQSPLAWLRRYMQKQFIVYPWPASL